MPPSEFQFIAHCYMEASCLCYSCLASLRQWKYEGINTERRALLKHKALSAGQPSCMSHALYSSMQDKKESTTISEMITMIFNHSTQFEHTLSYLPRNVGCNMQFYHSALLVSQLCVYCVLVLPCMVLACTGYD